MMCECSDRGCPVHEGDSECSRKATNHVWRVDMEDRDGLEMCEGCASDALDSGVFTSEDPHQQEIEDDE